MIRRPPRSTLFPTRRSSDLLVFVLLRPAAGSSTRTRTISLYHAPRTTHHGPRPTPPCAPQSLRYNRSEEHTSELQSQSNLVCRLLLEKKTTTAVHRLQSTST